MIFFFNIDDRLKQLIEHTIENHTHHRMPYCGEGWGTPEQAVEKPSLMLVKDRGVYLMSPFTGKGAPESARLKAEDVNQMFVCYAQDRGADTHLRGDDYCEMVPIPDGYENFNTLMVRVSSTEIEVMLMNPRPAPVCR